jgi:uroporphyrinogen decarboxylase
MKSLKNDRLLKTIRKEPVDMTPVWIMRQAGRYLPEYRALRKKAGSFLKLCKTPELACEVTLQPLARFPLDAAILFSDILTIPDAMGLGLYFKEGEGPGFEKTLRHERDIQALPPLTPDENLKYVLDAIQMIQHELSGNLPLIGFSGSPWTVATYMVEGSANKAFPAIRLLMQENPRILHLLLQKLTQATIAHLNAQIRAGVDVVMLFDTWGGMLDTAQYQAFSLNYAKEIFNSLNDPHIPKILFTKAGSQWIELMTGAGCDVIGVDWLMNLNHARAKVKDQVALQGNMNPSILYQAEEEIRAAVATILNDYGPGPGHIFNLGHGIPQDVPPENVAIFVDAVHTLSQPYHVKK